MTRTTTRRALLGAAALTALAGAAGAQELKIGAINPYSGPVALYGDEVARGYEIAADQANAQGGVLGRKIVVVRGNASTPQEGIAAVEQLVGRDKVDVLVGTYTSAVSATASEAALNYGKLYWETNAVAANLTERGLPNFVRTGPYSAAFADRSVEGVVRLIAPALGKDPKAVKVWIEHEDSTYGTSIGQRQAAEFKKAGAQVVGVGAHSARAIDLTDSVLRARNAAPDVWINTGYVPDLNLLLRTARDQGFRPPAILLVGSGDTFETLEALGKETLNGVFLTSYPRPDVAPAYGPGAAAYLEAYRTKFGKDPIAPQSMNAFVGFKILLEAIKAANGTDAEKVRKAAAAMDKPLGAYETGYGVKFDDQMQNTRAIPVIAQWQEGRVVTVYPKEAAAPDTKLVGINR